MPIIEVEERKKKREWEITVWGVLAKTFQLWKSKVMKESTKPTQGKYEEKLI